MKKFLRILRSFVVVMSIYWLCTSAIWFAWYQIKYVPLSKNMTEVKTDEWHSVFGRGEYTYTDADGYQFALYMPSFLNYNNGELLLTRGVGDDYQILIIRIFRPNKYASDYNYLVQFGNQNTAAETDISGNLSSGNIYEKHQEDVKVLLEKAKVIWPSLK